jgi:hypothetical protein
MEYSKKEVYCCMEERVRIKRCASQRVAVILCVVLCAVNLYAQTRVPATALQDSLHVVALNADSLWKADSIYLYKEAHSKQVATMRELDLNGDGKPETLRLEGVVKPHVDDIELHFTIRSGKKTLYKESWKASGYFDPHDSLSDNLKIRRLRHSVSTFFANENFSVADSSTIAAMLKDASPMDVQPGSAEILEIEKASPVIFNVFRSRDFFYGLVWLPSKKRFVRLWRN